MKKFLASVRSGLCLTHADAANLFDNNDNDLNK
jgi:hypothetical protein